MSSIPEVQYVTLRNINLLLQRHPEILGHELRVFFCKYNDPLYVKLEKLEIMVRLCHSGNVEQVLAELKEYAAEVDVDFVRKSIRAIGRCAVKTETSSERCMNVLLELIRTKVNYVVQESVIVIKVTWFSTDVLVYLYAQNIRTFSVNSRIPMRVLFRSYAIT